MYTTPTENREPVYDGALSTPVREFSASETVYAWLCLLAGYACNRSFPMSMHPLGAFLFTLALLTASAVVLAIKGYKFSLSPCIAAASSLVLSASLIFTSNGFLNFLAYSYSFCTALYFVLATTENTVGKGFDNLVLLDYLKAVFIMPMRSFGIVFCAIFSGKKLRGKVILKALVGVLCAIIPTIVVMLLLSYDSGFRALVDKVFSFGFEDVLSHTFSFILGLPIGMYLYGLFVSSVDSKCKEVITADKCKTVSRKLRIAPTASVLGAVVPMLFVYVLFFISQWKYYVSGFSGILPDSTSYADYARDGFFQLCAVAVINLCVLISVSVFMRRKGEKPSVVQRALAIVISVCTLILIATALAKMIMYINCYGLTLKRIYASWFMVVLALVFVIIIIKQFVSRMPVIALSFSLCVVCFAFLAFSDVNTVIAEYNVDRYIEGTLDDVDVEHLEELGDASLPSLVRLAKHLDTVYDKDIREYMEKEELYLYLDDDFTADDEVLYSSVYQAIKDLKDYHELTFFTFSLPSYRAEKALQYFK